MKLPPKPPVFSLDAMNAGNEEKRQAFLSAMMAARTGPYEHWDEIRFKPHNELLTPEEVWSAIKIARASASRRLPFVNTSGQAFHYAQFSDCFRALHEIDSNARGLIGMPGAAATPEGRDVYLQKSLLEEPFSSSVLEGAATTREIAKKMIEEGRKPKTVSERMVLNNYEAMRFIREHRSEPLTPARIFELHRLLTVDTLDKPEKVGILRSAEDDVRVVDSITGETLHMPPPASELSGRLRTLCEFANEPSAGADAFLHPVIRAIILHFMLAYDHPFWDGNGRCARALFYWCVLRHGYWLLEYVSISAVIVRAPSKYGMAFLHSETDDGDLTYFIDHQLGVAEKSLRDLEKYLVAKSKELNELGKALGVLERRLNRRQLALLQEALNRPAMKYGIAAHRHTHGVSYLTARADLEGLAALKLLTKAKDKVTSVYGVPTNLKERLTRLAK